MRQAVVVRPEEEVFHIFSVKSPSAAASVLVPSLVPGNRALGDVYFPSNLSGSTKNANVEIRQIGLATGCWVWDYLRRSHQAGLFLPLSGGIDSCATAVIVFSMTRLVYAAMVDDNKQVIEDARRICAEPKDSKWMPSKPEELCYRIFDNWFAIVTVFSLSLKADREH